jgi:hypothetical protein
VSTFLHEKIALSFEAVRDLHDRSAA